ncbi:cell wall hydrolase [Vibrio parahaemolyticus]|uniref:cell wall hydrolase n=1 Tax=Vibrio parahaemolyticus TaxID=670 RepID=UPI0004256425|nr:cell wall hydrolase [Vibrio parahaemolyticus]HCE5184938.1 cell wall hydrolase [Vibrio parahaemolyticus]
MDLFAVLAVCAALSGVETGVDAQAMNQADCDTAKTQYQSSLQSIQLSGKDRDAIGRVAFAEAANQGDSGLAGVVYTILNRLISGQFGDTVTAIVNAPKQFEPVHKAGGWTNLPVLSPIQQTRVETIINLALEGRLPDLTNGALFFQNPEIVASREKKGNVSKGLTHFGGSTPSAVIQDHAFYASINRGSPAASANNAPVKIQAEKKPKAKVWDAYGVAEDKALAQAQSWDVFGNGGAGDSVLIGGKETQ